jgi:transposase
VLAAAYCSAEDRPAEEPLLLLKLEFLQYHYNLSDRQVVDQAHYNMAFRWFLGLSLDSPLPHPTLLTHFRQRLGWQKHQAIFDALIGQAREQGLVTDRLRLKDATHVIANIAIPSTIGLIAQTRQRLLHALRPWAAVRVAQEGQQALAVRTATADLGIDERLLQRVAHLRGVVAWADTVP